MKKRILIPTDGSQFSEQIIAHVQRFFAPNECELIVMRVGEPVFSATAAQAELVREATFLGTTLHHVSERDMEAAQHPIYATQIEMNERSHVEDAMLPLLNRLRQAGYNVTCKVEFGDPARMILHAVEHDKIDIIAMTTHGRQGLNRAIFGSVAESVMHQTRIPVLLFRPQ